MRPFTSSPPVRRRVVVTIMAAALALALTTAVFYCALTGRRPTALWDFYPPLRVYLWGYGVLLVLGAVGAATRARQGGRGLAFPLLWVGLTAVLVHLPWNLRRRFLEGIQVPLGLLAGVGLAQIADRRLQIARGKRLAQAAVVALAAMSNLYLTAGLTLAAANRSLAFFWPADLLAGVDWLRDHSAWDEVVLAAFETGNLIPARIGHGWCWAIGWRRWTLRGKRRRWLASSLPTRPMMCGGLC
ncbi:MAG: hypothetical protein DRI80_14130 [Chloroflexota bacterium]|nr:MAG: hypothetical protein DRI80_14130 [Chloroflexota bacterium]